MDARSDLFAFGALLYEMLSGEPAFRRETGVETLHAVLKEPAPRLPRRGSARPAPVLQRVLDRCLAKAPDDRYAAAADLLADLREARRRLGRPTPARAPGARAGPARARRRRAPAGPLRVVIVDDEEPARSLLREYLDRAGGVEIVGECRNGFEAVKAVNDLAPDLLFLDIQMPKLNGFEVLELLGRDVAVVFVTAFDDHAIRAFEVNAVDYVLKPVSPERVAPPSSARGSALAARAPMPVAEIAAAARPAGQPASRIVVRQGPRVHVIPADKLDYAEAQDDYVSLHSEGKSHLKQQTLSDLEASLDPARFVRIHRSYLLNLDRLSRIDTEGGEPKAVRAPRRHAPAAQPLRLRPAEGAALASGAVSSLGSRRSGTGSSRKRRLTRGCPSAPMRDAAHLGAGAEVAALLLDHQDRSAGHGQVRRPHERHPRPQVLDRHVLLEPRRRPARTRTPGAAAGVTVGAGRPAPLARPASGRSRRAAPPRRAAGAGRGTGRPPARQVARGRAWRTSA